MSAMSAWYRTVAMTTLVAVLALMLALAALLALIFTLRGRAPAGFDAVRPQIEGAIAETRRMEDSLRGDLGRQRNEMAQALDRVRETIETKLTDLRDRNDATLGEIRRTVDEKLQGTLDKRLGESFDRVSKRLEEVHKGLGEMQTITAGVGSDLKRVLTNVKTRGTWGEIQLGALLEQMLAPQQYQANVAPKPGSGERVEYAIRLPGREAEDVPVWLPIDAKFPLEDYVRLVEASERADSKLAEEAGKALEVRLRACARDIRTKYVAPPHTTDFALLFLPSEGLYAEVARRPGLMEALQRDHRVAIAGPTTLAALLNSLQMGFRTLAVQQRSSEVWKVLGAVKTEFGRFGEVLAAVKKKLAEASSHIEKTETRTRAIGRKLREVEALPAPDAACLLPEATATEESGTDDPDP
ncbi:MAG: DNA recombination protein RmuC [Myxococcota bacterium]|nr:DNA recombination protein RmuC [Myxococcota bacterium]